jgi:hypothetical protein
MAVCLHGCSRAVAIDAMATEAFTGTPANLDGVVAILCQRDQAERR